MKKRLKRVVTLLIYIGVTIALYYGVCLLMHRPFTELHYLYGALIGCVAYLPQFIAERKKK
ncbi:hypothetical protein [Bacteroides sp.]